MLHSRGVRIRARASATALERRGTDRTVDDGIAMRAYGAAHRDCESHAEDDGAYASSTETIFYQRRGRDQQKFRVISLAVALGALVACGAMINAARGNVPSLGTVLAAEADDGVTGADAATPPGPSDDTECLNACGDDAKSKVMDLLDMRMCNKLDGIDKSCLSTDACQGVRKSIKAECPDAL